MSQPWVEKEKKLIWHIWFGAQTLTERMSRCFSVRRNLNCSRLKLELLEQKMIIFGGPKGHKSDLCDANVCIRRVICRMQLNVSVCVFNF